MQQGTVRVWNDLRGYGFIAPDDGACDVFVHFSAIEAAGRRTLVVGGRVQFEVVSDDSGKRAERVMQISELSSSSLGS